MSHVSWGSRPGTDCPYRGRAFTHGVPASFVDASGGHMIEKLFEAVFGCKHERYSFPRTIRSATQRPLAADLTGTYVVCLDCARELPYDWQEMQVIRDRNDIAISWQDLPSMMLKFWKAFLREHGAGFRMR